MPKPKKIYVLRPDGGVPVVFLPHPLIPGAWIRTDASVLVTECHECKAPQGQPCHNVNDPSRYSGSTHWRRRAAARGKTDTIESVVAVVIDRRQVKL